MNETANTQLTEWGNLLPSVAACIEAVERDHFESQLLALLHQAVGIEQCMIFGCSTNGDIDCLLASNHQLPRVADRLARLYVSGLFRQDPNYLQLSQLAVQQEPSSSDALTTMQVEAMSPAYRSHLFAFPDLIDKVSLNIAAKEGAYYLNLYRGPQRGPFTPANLDCLNSIAPLLTSLLRRHYSNAPARPEQLSAREAAALAPLTDRERQLCLYLLRGHTLKTAAAKLDIAFSTTETYRKRAYAKLGIASKAGLVALCKASG
ncbi:helix-turn-helix transcriptional regulator [Halomonas sp. 7T]|uniref:helix-turn-helix transcriptional regulator n=1 Tax=Halomonas sp. 7T TaxID=2893469 RepID=UPI0021DA0F09|nr:LuxR C-terminal-related transcriptional regulator [Halomonas sp. 7T]UXZ54204.1 helix-turn-helix transcriptional regulator [Halomonas sp. 7T]